MPLKKIRNIRIIRNKFFNFYKNKLPIFDISYIKYNKSHYQSFILSYTSLLLDFYMNNCLDDFKISYYKMIQRLI